MRKVSLVTSPDVFDAPREEPSFIFLRKKKNKRIDRKIIAISSNGHVIYNGQYCIPSEEFMYNNKDSECLHMVLTDRELLNIKEFAVRYNVRVCSIESYYPFFSYIKYSNDLEINLDNLINSLHYAKSLGLQNHSFSKVVTQGFRNTLVNKLYMKNEFDSKFYFAYSEPYQEVFRFLEARKNRTIVALDFNSMFASCLKGDFIDPKHLEFVSIKAAYDGNELSEGIYKVALRNPKSSFIRSYHLFRLTKDFKKYAFSLSGINEIEATLHKEEIEYYHKHFSTIWIDSGYISKTTIGHPLYKKSTDLYKKRLRSKNLGKKTLEKKYKLELAMLHSITNSKSFKSREFRNLNEVSTFLRKEFGIDLDFSKEASVKNFFKRSHFSLNRNSKGFTLRYVDIYSKVSAYSLSSQVMAKVRLKMLTLLEELLRIDKIELCYINTDCVHVSFPKDSEKDFWEKTQHLVGGELGKLKVEAIADSGYWFDVGRYFLFDKGKVVKFSNSGLNHRGNTKPFLLTKPMVMHYKSSTFSHVTKVYSHFSNLLTYSKKLVQKNGYSDYARFTAAQILEPTSLALLEQEERENSSVIKLETYHSLMKSNHI
ncbi:MULTISPECIES: hypothetical protein [Vibrio]|jgi:hypothetical protein|uniref:hypothetical protein n=1 Tax=Vibrio TaxID=662 RepID=UPI00102DE3F1|nr:MULTISPECIES: hypothetical protein [Vibrio]ELP3325816.1 hypothetical protein [Vibrio alginolyticus]MBS9825767.1 hypothetical protein [Vibrio alginolyticus]MDL2014606.1 hypothetical protein [Vibrio parahaemolyticus]MDL2036638.1 hypothetical protein [Vibrio parahaemolyticus]MDW1500188.1 hypothetical protein [Vibrio sp. YT-19(2023)]